MEKCDKNKDVQDDSLLDFDAKSRKKFEEREQAEKENLTKFSSQNLLNKKRLYSDQKVLSFMKEFEKATDSKFVRRSSHKKEKGENESRFTANENCTRRNITYTCYHGPKRETTSVGTRNVFTAKQDCQARIIFSLSDCGKFYIISAMHDKHTNHRHISKKARKLMQHNRKMNEAQKKEIAQYHEKGGNKLSLLTTLNKLGPTQTFKSISNETEKIKKKKPKNSLRAMTDVLKENGAHYEIKLDASGKKFEAIYFSMPRMREDFEAWPEYMAMDGTYKLLNIKYPVIITIGIDGNGATRIFGMFIVKHETKEIIEWCFRAMKTHNEKACGNVKVFMGDKDLIVREVIPNEMPNVKRTICIFHAQQTFRRIVNGDLYDINKEQKEATLRILQSMVYALNAEEYESLYNQFMELPIPVELKRYFIENWHNIKNEWIKCFMTECVFKNHTNNRLESLNQKLNYMCDTGSDLADFTRKFVEYYNHLTDERDTDSLKMFLKVPAKNFDETRTAFYQLLTLHAYEYVSTQLDAVASVHKIERIGEGQYFIKNTDEKNTTKYTTTTNTCSCFDAVTMKLPCRHIFKIRSVENLDFYNEGLVSYRWTKNHYSQKNPIYKNDSDTIQVDDSLIQELNVLDNIPKETMKKSEIQTESSENQQPLQNEQQTVREIENREDIQLQPLQSKRGRPKRSRKVNAIGLKLKSQNVSTLRKILPAKKKLDVQKTSKLVSDKKITKKKPFQKTTNENKIKLMLSWIIKPSALKLEKSIYDRNDLIDLQQDLPCWIFDEILEDKIVLLKRSLSKEAFADLQEEMDKKRDHVNWICYKCKKILTEESISCDFCLKWEHFQCAGINSVPEQFSCDVCLLNS